MTSRARDGCDDGCKEHAAPRHSRLRQYLWVDDDDVRHCEERGQTGHDLSGHGGAVLLKMEELFPFFPISISLGLVGTFRLLGGAFRRELRLALWNRGIPNKA